MIDTTEPRKALEAVCDAVEKHGWSLFVIEDDGSRAWFALDAETDEEMAEWNKLADETVADLRPRFPSFVFRADEDYGNCDEPNIGTVYIDVFSQAEAVGRGLVSPQVNKMGDSGATPGPGDTPGGSIGSG